MSARIPSKTGSFSSAAVPPLAPQHQRSDELRPEVKQSGTAGAVEALLATLPLAPLESPTFPSFSPAQAGTAGGLLASMGLAADAAPDLGKDTAAFEHLLQRLTPPRPGVGLPAGFSLPAKPSLTPPSALAAALGMAVLLPPTLAAGDQRGRLLLRLSQLSNRALSPRTRLVQQTADHPESDSLVSLLTPIIAKLNGEPNEDLLDANEPFADLLASLEQGPVRRRLEAIGQALPEDIDQLVERTLLTLSADSERDLHAFVQEMQVSQRERAALTQLRQQQKEAIARVEAARKEEFDGLRSRGAIRPDLSFENYAAWRKITWAEPQQSADGSFILAEPTLAEPRPPALPVEFVLPPSTPANESTASPAAPLTAVGGYGLTDDVVTELRRLHQQLPIQEKLGGESGGQPTALAFEEWLSTLGLKHPVSDVAEARSNLDTVRRFAETLTSRLHQGSTQGSQRLAAELDKRFRELKGELDKIKTALSRDPEGSRESELANEGASRLRAIKDKLAAFFAEVAQSYLNDTDREWLTRQMQNSIADANTPYYLPVSVKKSEEPTGPNGEKLFLVDQATLILMKTLGAALPTRVELDAKFGATAGYFTTESAVTLPPLKKLSLSSAPSLEYTVLEQHEGTQRGAWTPLFEELQNDLSKALEQNAENQAKKIYGSKHAVHQAPPAALKPLLETVARWQPSSSLSALGDEALGRLAQQRLQEIIKQRGGEPQELAALVTLDAKNFVQALAQATVGPEFHEAGQHAPVLRFVVGDTPSDPNTDRLAALLLGSPRQHLDPLEKALQTAGRLPSESQAGALRRRALQEAKLHEEHMRQPQRAKAGYGNIGTFEQFATSLSRVDQKLDSLSELGTLQSTRLQMLMERRSRFFETLSNVLKKMATSADNIIGNVKS